MRIWLIAASVMGACLLLVAGLDQAGGQAGPVAEAGIDLVTTGNTGTSVGTIQGSLNNVALNTPFDIDIFVKSVPGSPPADGLYGVGGELTYNKSAIQVTGHTTRSIPGEALHLQGSDVPLEQFDGEPDTDGSYRFDSVDLSGNDEVGQGVVMRITIECIAQGPSHLGLTDVGFDGQGTGGVTHVGLIGPSGNFSYAVTTEREADIGCGTAAPTPSPVPSLTATPSATPTTTGPTPTPSAPGTATATPTATSGSGGLTHGDFDCDLTVNTIDALKVLRYDAGLGVAQQPGCPAPGSAIPASLQALIWGDIDCDGAVIPADSLKTLRFDAGLSVAQEPGCPAIGELV